MSSECLTVLDSGALIGMTLTTVAAFLGIVTILPVLVINLMAAVFRPPDQTENLLRRPRDVLLLGLLGFDFLQALGMGLSVKWLSDRAVRCSALCTAQGILSIIGGTGSAMLIIAITIYTILTFVNPRVGDRKPTWIPVAIIAGVTLYLILLLSIEVSLHHNPSVDTEVKNFQADDFIVPSPFWCWFGSRFRREKLAGEYIWLWLAAISSFFYIPMGMRMKHKNITQDKYYFRILLYPIAFTVLVLTISVVRWRNFTGHPVSDTAFWAGSVPFYCMPFVNFLLLVYVRGRVNLVNLSLDTPKEDTEFSMKYDQIDSPGRSNGRRSTAIADSGGLPD